MATQNMIGSAYSATPTANFISQWDANKNHSANNHINGYTTVVTAAGTTTLTVSSTLQQFFTGTTTQTVVLPVTSTLVLGHTYRVVNNSTGAVTVQSSGANTIVVVAAGSKIDFTCILTSGTTAASWDFVNVGEYAESIITQGSGTALTTNTAANITTLSLTAGDWNLWGNVAFLSAATTAINDLNGWISTTSATIPAGNLRSQRFVAVAFTPGIANESFCVPFKRLNLATTTTVYLSVQATFATSTLEGSGGLFARRAKW